MADLVHPDIKVSTPRAQKGLAFGKMLQYRFNRVLLYIILIFGAVIAVVPFFWMVSTSFMTLGETINRVWIPSQPQVVNYIEAWGQAKFGKYFINSVVISAVTLAGLLISSVLAGYAFGRIKFCRTGYHLRSYC